MKNVIFRAAGQKWIETFAPAYNVEWIAKEVENQTGRGLFKGAYDPSIIGIRTLRDKNWVSNKFQDFIYVTFEEERGGELVRTWYEMPATTLAGRSMYNSPINTRGTAQLESGFHKGIWERGKHKGKKALIQTGNKVTVIRDLNGDDFHNWDGLKHRGWFGINFHTASHAGTSTVVNGWSAGCQVTNISQVAFGTLLRYLKYCESKTGYTSYSYFLLDSDS